jgi:hypothetical protein
MLIGRLLPQELCWEMTQLNLGIVAQNETLTLEIESTLEPDIRKGQLTNEKIVKYKKLMNKDLCGSRTESVYPRFKSCKKLY